MRYLTTAWIPAVATLALACSAAAGRAQIPYTVFDDATEVRSLGFQFTNGRTFSDSRLKRQIVLTERGRLYGIKETLAFLPFIGVPLPHPFTPIDLQRDVARLRRFYEDAGFIGTEVAYDVNFNAEDNVVDVDFMIAEGRPVIVRSIEINGAEGDLMERLPADLQDDWQAQAAAVRADSGGRYTQAERTQHESTILNWWLDRGWAFASVETGATIDSTAATADLQITVTPGPRARIGPITIEGHRSVSEDVIRRALPFSEGDWFSASEIADGQRRLFGLELFRLALIDVAEDQQRDSTALIRVRIEESPPRLVTGELGYISVGGVSARGEFAHRNFMGGARTLRVSGLAQSGTFAIDAQPEREYRLSVTFREPYFFDRRLSANVSPFGQYRDNLTDRSWQAGLETSLIWELGAYRLVTLTHRISTRRILDFRLGSGDAVDLETLLRLIGQGALDSLGRRIDRSTIALASAIGRFDPTRPTRALQARPSIEVTTPSGFNTIEYALVDLPITGFRPLTDRIAIAARLRFGRVFPFGKTVRGDTIAGLLEGLQLRDVLLTAGGTGSVRGWGDGLLGPKFVNLLFSEVTEDSLDIDPRGYAPSGGLARAAASLELQLPFPGLGESWGTHIFLDAGRVWTPDDRFRGEDPLDLTRWYYGTGLGIDTNTLVGPIRVSFGWKLNPSPLDLRDAADVFAAIRDGRPVTSAPTRKWRRLHLHISLGQSF
jgi:outer membrane protein insertion porin family